MKPGSRTLSDTGFPFRRRASYARPAEYTRACRTGFESRNERLSIGAGRTSRHSPWSFFTSLAAKPVVSQATGRQNSPAARMAASSRSPSAADASRGRSGPAIQVALHSAGSRNAVSIQVGSGHALATPPASHTRTDQ